MAAPEPALPYLPKPGVTLLDSGAVFCVYAGSAQHVELCLFDATGAESRVPLTRMRRGYWAVFVADVSPGLEYGYRVWGAWEPQEGLRYNPNKLLIDPYAQDITGVLEVVPEIFGHVVATDGTHQELVMDTRDSAPFVPRSVVVESSAFDWGEDAPPQRPMHDSVIYELHLAGFTRLNKVIPAHLRGTYAGLGHPETIAYLNSLGVTAVELLPVHAFVDEPHLVALGLSNYWGYNTLNFFAPHRGYASGAGHEAISEFKAMVKAFHAAGIEVILDVVYNHTAEQGGHEGPLLSLRGFDQQAYYRLDEGGRDIDVTGCGNSLDARHPAAAELILDSLRYWVNEMHVDGFRFDLAVTLGRGPGDDFDARNALFLAMHTDPVLSRVKLIAEPWDVGMHGWRTGQFPQIFSEWNDQFRNTIRDFWLTDVARSVGNEPGHGVADVASRLAGSSDLFGGNGRGQEASINYVTAHDGFTLADLTAYNEKHNEANGEDNRDGTSDNRSWNHGIEGPTTDVRVTSERRRSQRNLLGTLLLAGGVPMLTAGDEWGRTQGGNNNAYCQNSEISWVPWAHNDHQRNLLATSRQLISWRRRFAVLRHPDAFPGTTTPGDEPADLRWYNAHGQPMGEQDWRDTRTHCVQAFFDAGTTYPDSVLVVLHGSASEEDVAMPAVPHVRGWELLWDSAVEHPQEVIRMFVRPGDAYRAAGASMQLFLAAR